MSGPRIDPITLEVIVEAFLSVVREMRVTVIRTAYSSVVCQGHDFSCGLFDPKGQLIAQSEDLPMHVLPMSWSIREIVERFGEEIRPGDVFLVNDPSYGGTHLNDVMVAMPVFADGELFLFPAVRAHWLDVGGMVPGSLSGAAREIYQEGMVIPPIRVYDEGRPNDAALDLLFANCRLSEDRRGDFRAGLSACKLAERGVVDLVERYGAETLAACVRRTMDRAEERTREQVATIPPGEYHYEDYLESFEEGRFVPVRCCVRLEVKDRSVTADFTGTSPQVGHPINCSYAVTASGVFIPLKTILDPDYPVNHGSFRPIRVIVPEGTIFNARRPAPVGGCCEVEKRATGLVLGALAQAIPDRVPADQYGTVFHNMIGGMNRRTGRRFVYYEWPKGGSGGYAGSDGQSVMAAFDEGDTRCIHSAEALETEFPVEMECSVLRTDSGGAGRRMGGLGVKRQVRVLSEGTYSMLADRAVLPSYGLGGGRLGKPTAAAVLRKGREIHVATPGKCHDFPINRGDRLVMLSGGGGGYGDPLNRPVEAVEADVRAGYISRKEAERSYGVVFTAGGEIDKRRTAARKRTLSRKTRAKVGRAEALGGEGLVNGRRVCVAGRNVASRLGLRPGMIVELLGTNPAPLRAWVELNAHAAPGRIFLDAYARTVIGVNADDFVHIRGLDNLFPEKGTLAEGVHGGRRKR
ncbi:MAG: hydantoinase B/oxoprolinase family protein [Nitrospinota bacterium]|jgi:N-methylhydantoinase B|nr:hydantoinase B/oxoprolinase family protein [Nitrospinota bacterium]HJM43619.1 hydantoinase B/oxoprolinase family protein [Nitrospinota bacterium]